MRILRVLCKEAFLIIVFLLIIFAPPIRFLPYYTWILAGAGVWTLSDKNFYHLIGFGCRRNLNFIVLLLIMCLYNCIIVPTIHGFQDFTYIPIQLGIILALFRNILLIYILYKFSKNSLFSSFAKYFLSACCIYVSFTLVFIIYPAFKQFWMEDVLANVVDRSTDFAVYQFRYGIDGFAAFSSASVFSFACLFCSYLVSSSRKIKIIQLACLIYMVVGCFFYGRISLVGMLFGATLILWSSDSIVKTLRIVGIILIFVSGLLLILNIASESNELLVLWQDWAFSIVKQLFVEKEVTDYSVNHMFEDMYYMPGFFTFLFGDGLYTCANGSYYGHTDVGFMRLLLYGGIFDLCLIYSIVIYLARIILRISKSSVFRHFIFLATLLFFILEMKGESYQRAFMLLYPLYLIQNLTNNTDTKNENKTQNIYYYSCV